jgi:DNA-binding CsgD family transcriptional regulator
LDVGAPAQFQVGANMHADAEGRMSAISLNRDTRGGFFRKSELDYAHRLLPHLRNIYSLQRRLSWLEAQVASFRAALDRLAFGAILLDRGGCVLFANTEALKVFHDKAGMVDRERRLRAVWHGDTLGLCQLIERACSGVLAAKPDSMPLRDARGNVVITASISPLAAISALSWSEPNAAAVLFVHRLQPTAEKHLEQLCAAFGFTVAESQLVEQLLCGATLSRASAALGKRMPTLRSQLRALFDKTGTRRQAELLRLLERA